MASAAATQPAEVLPQKSKRGQMRRQATFEDELKEDIEKLKTSTPSSSDENSKLEQATGGTDTSVVNQDKNDEE